MADVHQQMRVQLRDDNCDWVVFSQDLCKFSDNVHLGTALAFAVRLGLPPSLADIIETHGKEQVRIFTLGRLLDSSTFRRRLWI